MPTDEAFDDLGGSMEPTVAHPPQGSSGAAGAVVVHD